AADHQRDRAALDFRLKWHALFKWFGAVPVWTIFLQARRRQVHARQDRRSGIVTDELAHLPLPREEPQRVADLGLQRAVEIQRARAAFQPVPEGDRRERAFHQFLLDVADDELLLSHCCLLRAPRTPGCWRRGWP